MSNNRDQDPAAQQAGSQRSEQPELWNHPYISGIWYQGPHSECAIQGRHRHDIDGSIFFSSIGSVMETIRRMQGDSVELWRVADAMQRGQRVAVLDPRLVGGELNRGDEGASGNARQTGASNSMSS